MSTYGKGGAHHIVSPRIYALIFAALMVGTAITVLAARVDFGPMNIFIAMAIAITKATLVVLYFMHLRYSERLTQIFAAAGMFWLVLLIALTWADYFTRYPRL